MIFIFAITFFDNMYVVTKTKQYRLVNVILCNAYSAFLLYDEYKYINFLRSNLVSWVYDITLCFFVMESVYGAFIYITIRFPSVIDIDLLTVSVYFVCIKIFRSLKESSLSNSFRIDVRELILRALALISIFFSVQKAG